MGGKLVDSPDQHMVGEPFHKGIALCPAVIAEDLTQRPVLLVFLDMGSGTAQLGQAELEEFPVPVSCDPLVDDFREPRHDLVVYHINACHMLSCHLPEIMANATGHPGMGIVILDDMADVLYPMVCTPSAKLSGKAFLHQTGHPVHIHRTHISRLLSGRIP